MFSALSAVFLFLQVFVCFVLVWLFIIWPFIRFQGVKFAKFNSDGNEYNSYVSVRYNSVFISLPLFTKGHKTTT